MFNLLPENIKVSLKKEYSIRRFIIVMFFIAIVQITFLVFIFPTWMVSAYKEEVISEEYDKFNKISSDSNIDPIADRIQSINKKLGILNNVLQYPTLVPYVDTVLSNKSSSIFIEQFSFSLKNSKEGNLAVAGVAKTRESLVSFVDLLKEADTFKEVNLPISNLAKDKDIDFTIELVIEQK